MRMSSDSAVSQYWPSRVVLPEWKLMSTSAKPWRSFRITHVLGCLADPEKNRVIAEFAGDVSAVFPYLNAVVPNLMYNPGANTVTLKRGVRILTFYPRVAVMAKVDGAEDALTQLKWFCDLCDETWERRDQISPCQERRQLLGPLDVYLLLPGLNCRRCGEATCMALAFGLLLGERRTADCPGLEEPAYQERARRLAELLGETIAVSAGEGSGL